MQKGTRNGQRGMHREDRATASDGNADPMDNKQLSSKTRARFSV